MFSVCSYTIAPTFEGGGRCCAIRVRSVRTTGEGFNREHSADKPNHGYGERTREDGALGRYQLQQGVLQDAGWRHPDGTWTDLARRHGVESNEDFLGNPGAQEAAKEAAARVYENHIRHPGRALFRRIGQVFEGQDGQIVVTEAGLMAALHREGAGGTNSYFQRLDRAKGNSRRMILSKAEGHVEFRLRVFQQVPYRRSDRR